MKLSAYVTVCLAVVSAGLIVFWNARDDSMSASREGTEVMQSAVPLFERVESTTTKADESVNSESDQLERSICEQAMDSRLAERQQDMEDGIYQLVGTGVVQSLVESGLALSDSEEIARRLAAETAECTMDSLRIEAERQSISADELLSQLQATARDGGDPFDVADLSSMNTYAFPCQADAMQRAGIVYPSGAQEVSDEDVKGLMECVAGFNDSDIVDDRGVILEICTEEVIGEVP